MAIPSHVDSALLACLEACVATSARGFTPTCSAPGGIGAIPCAAAAVTVGYTYGRGVRDPSPTLAIAQPSRGTRLRARWSVRFSRDLLDMDTVAHCLTAARERPWEGEGWGVGSMPTTGAPPREQRLRS